MHAANQLQQSGANAGKHLGQPGTARASPSAQTYSILLFIINTGNDDLRGNSLAWAVVNLPQGGSQTCYLHAEGDSWPNNSTKSVPCNLGSNAMTLAQLKSAQIDIAFNGASVGLFQNPDEWVVQSVIIDYYNEDMPRRCLLKAAGNPLYKFGANTGYGASSLGISGASDAMVVTNYPNLCR
jgi:hypothetical protein